jgi:hypothetical protein
VGPLARFSSRRRAGEPAPGRGAGVIRRLPLRPGRGSCHLSVSAMDRGHPSGLPAADQECSYPCARGPQCSRPWSPARSVCVRTLRPILPRGLSHSAGPLRTGSGHVKGLHELLELLVPRRMRPARIRIAAQEREAAAFVSPGRGIS